jgi:hypothetical protein
MVQVEAVWFEDDIFYLARITAVHNDGESYDIVFPEVSSSTCTLVVCWGCA